MTDLSAKFSNLEDELGGKLDTVNTKLETVIEKLGDISTALTSASGNIDAAPIVAAIEALRGTGGPETTIRSINQSIWALAGPAPGITLTDLYSLWNPGQGILPYNLLDSLYIALITMKNNIGTPTGDATTTALGLLRSVQYALTTDVSNLETLYSLVRNINQSVNLPANVDDTVLGLLDKLLLQARATNAILDPIAIEPVDSCASPYTNSGTVYYQAGSQPIPEVPPLTFPGTFATFSGTPPTGISIPLRLGDPIELESSDWTNYRIYVASSANIFGISMTSAQRLPTNEWITLSITNVIAAGRLMFYVDGNESLKVYICPTGAPEPGEGYTLTTTYFSQYWYLVQEWPTAIPTSDAITATGDFYGWTAQHISGAVTVRFVPPGVDMPYVTLVPNQTITLPHTIGVRIGSKVSEDGGGETVLKLTPPA